jgi:hypothetical protein
MGKETPKRYAPAEAMRRIKSNLSNGETILTSHFTERLKKRGIDMQDVLNILRQGTIPSPPEPHLTTGRWIYNVEGETIEGESLKISVDIDDSKNVLLSVSRKGR